ncbi:MAG: hypothetical protein NC926_01865 [Candidatus Omnitrophica bacterium]|nr:hypothetical protein [Candidatus Omnitrophota bacterium]
MIEIGNKKIYVGDFHTHWYWDKENPTLFISGMYNLGYDFVLLCDGYEASKKMDDFCKIYEIPFRVFPGKEIANENAHIILWIDGEFEKYLNEIPKSHPYKFLKEKTKLIIFAHPGENWKDSFDGTYRPLLNLYKEKLIDAIQPQEYAPYKIFEEEKLKISVVGGFDIHCCKPFIKYPTFLFNKNFPVFKHIIPCSKYASVVISNNLDEENIINSVKNCLSVSYNIETGEFIGDKEIINFLIESEFVKKFNEEIKKRQKMKIKGKIFTGTENKIHIEDFKKIKYFIVPLNSFRNSIKVKTNKIKINQILNRENFYIPITLKDKKTYFYGLLVKSPIETKIFSFVRKKEGKLLPFIEIFVRNRLKKKLKIELKLEYEKFEKEFNFILEKQRKILIPAEIDDFGIEYDMKIKLKGENFNLDYDLKISFPVCQYTDNPWKIDKKTSIKIRKENIYNIENWRGEDDLSGDINLYWDKKFFYLYAEIIDDIFYQKWTDWETFWGDSIQFAFGPYLKKIDAYGFNYELIISKTKNGNEIFIWNKYGKTEQVRKIYKNGYLDVSRDEENKKTIYKLKIPWKFFKEFKAIENRRFLFSIIVLDNDGIIMKRKWFYYGENIGLRKSMKNAHTVTII